MKIFYSLLALGMLGFAVYLVANYNPAVSRLVLLLPVILAAGSVLIIVNLVKRKVVINDQNVLCVNVFLTRGLDFTKIKGCRVGQKTIYIEPLSPDDHRIVIGSYNDLDGSEELTRWIKDHFKDLDSTDFGREQEVLLQNSRLGSTEVDRQKSLKKSKGIALAYNIFGSGLGIALLFPNDKLSIIILLVLPIVGVMIMLLSKGVIKFVSDSKRSPYPYIAPGAALSGFALLLRSLNDYTLFRFNNLWLPAFIISGILFVLIYIRGIDKSVKPVWGQVIFMLILALLYGLGSTRQLNCAFDNSRQMIYEATVLGHRIYHGKSNSYYLTLSPWGPRENKEEAEVRKGLYNNIAIGDTVEVNFRQGLFHIPWFIVTGAASSRPVLIRPGR